MGLGVLRPQLGVFGALHYLRVELREGDADVEDRSLEWERLERVTRKNNMARAMRTYSLAIRCPRECTSNPILGDDSSVREACCKQEVESIPTAHNKQVS